MTVDGAAPAYPRYWEADVVLRDGGTAHVRPMPRFAYISGCQNAQSADGMVPVKSWASQRGFV